MKLTTRVVIPTVVAGTLAVGAAAIAWAASSPSPRPSTSTAPQTKANAGKTHGDRGTRADVIARRALHGELTVRARGQATNGSVPTTVVYLQRGEITAVDTKAKTVTVKSLDGFTRTYAVTTDTKIRSKGQDESFTDLKTGERAMVVAAKDGDKYVARVIRCVHTAGSGKQS
ncbi:MAG: hypothetical protein ACJ735_16080 [Actinomycetes bacterium]